ncbi:MAG: head GIN domain-containing protein [Melioribacteraceae bacterium]
MKTKLIALALIFGFILTGCGFYGIRGNGRIKSESRKVSEFSKIEAGGAFTIHVKVGPAASVKVSAEENLMGIIRTRVRGNSLIIDTRKNISPRKEIIINITTPSLDNLEVSGANNVDVENISCDEFSMELSGAGSVNLNGVVDRLLADLSGAGSINARELKAKDVRISVSGAASADVFASKYLDASVSGVGSIEYYGNPEKTKTDVSGVGSISRK